MAIFMDHRGRLAKLHKSRRLTFDQVQSWGLGTIIVSTDPYDVAVPMCVGYVVAGDTYCITRVTNVTPDPMVGYRLTMTLDGDNRTINVISQSVAAYNLVKAQLLLQNPVNIGVDAYRLFASTPLAKDPQLNLGINAGVRLFGDRFDELIQKAYKKAIIPVIGNEMYQELLRLEGRHELADAYDIGRITGYYTAVWNLQIIGEGAIATALLSRAATVRALTGLTENLSYQMAQLTSTS